METSVKILLSLTAIFIPISLLIYIYLKVRIKNAKIISCRVIELRRKYFSKYRRYYPVVEVFEEGEYRVVEFKHVLLRQDVIDRETRINVYRVEKPDGIYYYAVQAYYGPAYLSFVVPFVFLLILMTS